MLINFYLLGALSDKFWFFKAQIFIFTVLKAIMIEICDSICVEGHFWSWWSPIFHLSLVDNNKFLSSGIPKNVKLMIESMFAGLYQFILTSWIVLQSPIMPIKSVYGMKFGAETLLHDMIME